MKTNYIFQTSAMLFFVLTVSAQQGINYKAIINDANGDGLANMGTTEFKAVPYSLYAETANASINDNVDDADADPTNEFQSISLAGTTLSISDGNGVNLPIERITEEPGLILDHVILSVPGMQDREVLKIDFSISRQVDDRGQPTSSPNIDAIKIKVAALDDGSDELAVWICSPFDYKDGDIDYIETNGQILRTLSFKQGYLISYKEIYEPELGLIEEIVISPQEITTGNATLREIWN